MQKDRKIIINDNSIKEKPEEIEVSIDCKKAVKEFNHFYQAVGYANVDFTYTEPTKKMYDYLSSFANHFRYMRMHNILTAHGRGDYFLLKHGEDYGNPPGTGRYTEGGDTVAKINQQGKLICDWTVVDKVYDILMEHDIRPIIETVFMPSCLQKNEQDWFLPDNYVLWQELLHKFVNHLQERYGKEEVEQWYFEIWNEPDNQKLWREDSRTFLALYDYMERAIHKVNPELKTGGPATKQKEGAFRIFRDFLEHCSNGLNYATGKFGTRVDFISVHCKGGRPGEINNPSGNIMFSSLQRYLDILEEYPQFGEKEFINDESDVVWSGNRGLKDFNWLNFRNTHYFAGFVCKMVNKYCNIIEDKNGANLTIVDSDNCHLQWEKSLYSGNRSQFTPLVEYPATDLIKKPVFNAYVMLSLLGSKRLSVDCTDKGFMEKYGILPTEDENTYSIMVWNFEDGMIDGVNSRKIQIYLKNFSSEGNFKLVHYRIDKNYSNSHSVWEKMGKPSTPDVNQIDKIRKREGLELYGPVQDVFPDGDLELIVDMPMHSVSLFRLLPENKKAPEIPSFIKGHREKGLNNNSQIFLKWKPNEEKDFLYYRLYRRREDEQEFSLIRDNPSLNTAIAYDMNINSDYRYYYKVEAVNASMVESGLSDVIEV